MGAAPPGRQHQGHSSATAFFTIIREFLGESCTKWMELYTPRMESCGHHIRAPTNASLIEVDMGWCACRCARTRR